jgi:hypothetical protein
MSSARIHGVTRDDVDQIISILEPEIVNIKFPPN